MVIGFLVTVANFTALFLPAGVNLLCLLAVLPFANRSAGLANAGLFFLFALVLQVWQFKFWIDGAAAH
ncbi:hypothetical protein [Tabrizicola aquatica]|uniref:hypothetical protein n=1 Tax=Tabrizicola aquatica TaxID=909926 RepID=UPI000CD08566|nr:hypothetical protein [Tabrizicola aquatica]